MTQNSKLKKIIREQAAKDGVNYTTARRRVLEVTKKKDDKTDA